MANYSVSSIVFFKIQKIITTILWQWKWTLFISILLSMSEGKQQKAFQFSNFSSRELQSCLAIVSMAGTEKQPFYCLSSDQNWKANPSESTCKGSNLFLDLEYRAKVKKNNKTSIFQLQHLKSWEVITLILTKRKSVSFLGHVKGLRQQGKPPP